MSYETVEAALQTQLQATATLSDAQVTLADWDVLAQGHDQAAVLEYWGFESEEQAFGGAIWTTWTTRVHLYARYTDDAAVQNLLRDVRQEIINRVHQYPRLNNTAGVQNAFPRRGHWDDPQMVEIGGIRFLREYIEIEIVEDVTVTLQE